MKFKAILFASALLMPAYAGAATTVGTTIDTSPYTDGGSDNSIDNSGFAGSAGDGEVSRNYLQFSLLTTPNSIVSLANLNLSYRQAFNGASNSLSIFATSNNFTGNTSWNSRPALGTVLATFNPRTPGVYSFDVTNYVNSAYQTGGTVSFAVAATNEYFTSGTPNSWRYFNAGSETLSFVTSAAPAGAVPEPATWAMMLLGFGMIGVAARRRSSVKTTVRFA